MKALDPFTVLMSVDPLETLISTLPPIWRVGSAVILLSLISLYYIFLVIRAFPWSLASPNPDPKNQLRRGKRHTRRQRRRRLQRR